MSQAGDERAILFSRPGHERIDQLEAKRRSYEELLDKLRTLPQKLRHPGIIPVGPRLYLPGALVHTNEITVLLGRSGDASYFAERSAHQASDIVRRRLAIVDANLANVEVGKKEIQDAIAHQEARQEKVSVIEDETCAGKRVVHAASSDHPSVEVSPKSLKKRVSFNETLVVGPTMHPEQKVERMRSSISKKSVTHSDDNVERTSTTSTANDVELSSAEKLQLEQPKEVLSEMRRAIKAAERQVKEDGVVNITELYTDESKDPTHVELSPGFEPDQSISFDDDSEDYLDMTGKKPTSERVTASREDYWSALIEAEAEAEAEQSKEAEVEKKNALNREKKEFGSGFSKGFFGAPSTKKKSANYTASGSKSNIHNVSHAANEPPAVQEKVVERRPSRNRKARPKAVVTPRVESTHGLDHVSASDGVEREGVDEMASVQSNSTTPISKFRQMRNLQRNVSLDEN